MPAAKINPARSAALLTSLEDGNYLKEAAEAAGIHFTTVYDWLNRGDVALAAARMERPEIDAEIADWVLAWPDNFNADNGIWDAPVPTPFDEAEWPYVLLSVLSRKAKARAVTKAVANIRKAGRKNWQAAAWWLERTNGDRFGRKQSTEISGPGGGPIQLAEASPEELLQRVKQFKQARGKE